MLHILMEATRQVFFLLWCMDANIRFTFCKYLNCGYPVIATSDLSTNNVGILSHGYLKKMDMSQDFSVFKIGVTSK